MQGFGERIRGRARDLKLTDGELARRLGIDPSRLGKYIRDEREPDLTMLLKICSALDVSPDQLLLPLSPSTAPARDRLMSRIASSCRSMDDAELEMIARIVDAAALGRPDVAGDQSA
jgi:transcriptional regulator with XRE-family HTH domain